jgi:PadR family transcriptional regulator
MICARHTRLAAGASASPSALPAFVDNRHISAYSLPVRRKPGQLVPLETAICACAANLRRSGTLEFHGYEIAKRLGDESQRRLLTAYGTLYRALGRLEAMGLLESRWEDPLIPARENRPGRRMYVLTAAGETAADEVRQAAGEKMPRRAARRPVPA